MQFKTNAKCNVCVDEITKAVKHKFPDAQISLDLESADKVLHVHGVPEDSTNATQIENAIREAGFYGSWLTRGLENR